MEDKKKIAAMLVMGLKPKKGMKPGMDEAPEEEMGEEDSSDEGSDHEAAAQEVMDAMKSNDVAGFAEALKSFVKLCDYPEEEESTEEEV